MNVVRIHYCYPTSDMAAELGRPGFYVTVGAGVVISPVFRTIDGAEGFCRNKCLRWEPHSLRGGMSAVTAWNCEQAAGC